MSSLRVRNHKLYARVKDVEGVWRELGTGYGPDQREQAEQFVRDCERDVREELARRARFDDQPLTVTVYASKWLDRRTTKTANDDRTRIEKHALPVIGHLLLVDVRPRHLRDLILKLRADGELAPKTIRKLSGVLHTMFQSAEIEELIASNPVKYERGVLPKNVDKDPTWRNEAIYTRGEIEQLLSDERIPVDRRVLYALKFFTGRHTECATLTWRQYDAAREPLGAIHLGVTKSGVPRTVPVHPTLAKVLAQWKLSDWEDLYGHKPRAVDLIVPTRNLRKRRADESQKQLLADLDTIGLRKRAGEKRNRRGHDLRRTLISLARSDGAIDSILRKITHGPKAGEILDDYSTHEWGDLCREISKLKVSLLQGRVEAMWKVAVAGDIVAQNERPQRDSKDQILSLGGALRQSFRVLDGGQEHGASPRSDDLPHAMWKVSACDLGLELLRHAAIATPQSRKPSIARSSARTSSASLPATIRSAQSSK